MARRSTRPRRLCRLQLEPRLRFACQPVNARKEERMKYKFATLGALLLLAISCNKTVTLDPPTVSYSPSGDGASLHLTWLAVTNATAYNVYVDGVKTEV